MAFVRAGVDCYAGRNGPGIAAMSTVFAGRANWHDEIPNLVQSVLHARIQSAIFAGELAAAAEYTEVIHRPATESGTWERAVAVTGVIHGQVCRLRGEVREALRLGQAGLDWADQVQTGFSALVLGEYAHAAALLGKADAASAALARVECDILPATIVLAFPAVLARTWERAAQGDLPGAVRAALDAAAEADALELRGFRLFALHDVVRLGSARLVAADLRELEVDGELAPLCARHAEAAVAADGAALAEVSAGFQELGMILYAAEAAAQAARAYEAAGRVKDAHVLGGQAWVLARRCQGARTPALAWLAAPELTARQLEIAHLASAGLSNKEIADRSAISVRTVANHLGAVYERLGVHDRAELSALLGPVTR
jgi:DNA-binding CsgD family transcriptional regulator